MDKKRIPLLLVSVALIGVCGLCALTVYGTYAWFNTRADFRFFDLMNVSASMTETHTYDAKSTLILDTDSGDITILPGKGDTIEVEMVKTGWGTDQAEAENAANAIRVAVQETGETLKFTFNRPDQFGIGISRGGSDSVDFTIRVPADTAIEIEAGFGDVSITGLTQKIDTEVDFGSLTVENIEAGENSIVLVTSFGDLRAENIQGQDIRLKSSNGLITGTDLSATGLLKIDNSFGSIRLTGLRGVQLTIRSDNGTIAVSEGEVTGALAITNSFGDMMISDFGAESYTLASDNGKIDVHGATGLVQATNRFGDIEITHGVNVTLDLKSDNGLVAFSGTLNPEAAHTLKNSFGNIVLTLPEDSAFDLSLETSFGQIESEIPVTLTNTIKETAWDAEINGGGARITAKTDNGNISLRVLAEE
mgnify:CR=1 FL=1